MEFEGLKSESIAHSDLQEFIDHLYKHNGTQLTYTLDYLESSVGVTVSKEIPTKAKFCLALVHEILSNLKPNHELWNKIKYAAFILNLAERDVDFEILYSIFHQAEVEVECKNYRWEDEEVRLLVEDQVIAKVIVKEQFESKDNEFEYNDEDNGYDTIEMKPDIDTSKLCIDTENTENPLENKYDSAMKIKYETTELDDQIKPQRKFKKSKKKIKLDTDLNFEEGSKEKRKKDKKKGMYKCSQCKFSVKYQSKLDKHCFEKHAESRLCIQCGHLSSTYEEYQAHDKTHALNCDICGKKCLGKRSMVIHMKTVHEENSSSKKVPCDICGVFRTEESLRMHKLTAHGGEVHKCTLCDYTTTAKTFLTVHIKRHYMQPVQCPSCGKWVKDLNKHYNRLCSSQKKDRPSCDICGKTFSLKQGLVRHMKVIHQGVTEFKCDLCDFTCRQNSGLKQHIKGKHEKQKLFKKCPLCEQKTTNIEYHMKTNHYEEYVKTYPAEDPSIPKPVSGRPLALSAIQENQGVNKSEVCETDHLDF